MFVQNKCLIRSGVTKSDTNLQRTHVFLEGYDRSASLAGCSGSKRADIATWGNRSLLVLAATTSRKSIERAETRCRSRFTQPSLFFLFFSLSPSLPPYFLFSHFFFFFVFFFFRFADEKVTKLLDRKKQENDFLIPMWTPFLSFSAVPVPAPYILRTDIAGDHGSPKRLSGEGKDLPQHRLFLSIFARSR